MEAIKTLAEAKKGEALKVVELRGGQQFRQKLSSIGVRPGKILTVADIMPLCGPVVVTVDGRDIAIGRKMAERIFVKKV